ncbi:hypothetical protein GGX14DRAFT_404983 [Mycena pura]|uniref:Uncharacterized protein n=1 Tax=Mycena pura TaxID=153505 RepID=A0AAD6Y2Y6_9AGAR|nr:hypothetical protein GGX14DRAFT_404983 [Mycena pura]
MSDRTFEILLVTVLALVPGNTAHYIYLGLASASLAYHERLTRAPSTSVRDHVLLMDQEHLLRTAEKTESQLQCRLLEIESHGWKEYLRDVKGLLKDIGKCTKDVKRIQTKLQLSIEEDIQRKLDDEIQKSRDSEVLAAIHFGPRGLNKATRTW